MGLPRFTLEADLASDGLFSTDWTPYLEAVGRVGLSRASAVDDFGPRKIRITLNNNDSRFSPKYASGPYAGLLTQGKLIRLKVKVITPAIVNLLTNPSVETNSTGWAVVFAGGGNLIRTAVLAKHGTFCVLIVETTSGGYELATAASLTPSQVDYTASVWVRPTAGVSGPERIRLKLTESGGAAGDATTTGPYTVVGSGIGSVGVWRRLEVTHEVAESDRSSLVLTIEREDANWSSNQIIAYDSAQIEEGSSATLYCDGDQPGAAWAGSVHESISSRGADPEFVKFTGELQAFSVTRKDNVGEAQFEATGFLESALRVNIAAGPFVRKPANVIIRRVMDVLEASVAKRILGLEGELFIDPADRNGGNTWVVVAGTLTETVDTGEAGADPVDFEALEGDNVTKFQTNGVGNTAEAYVDLKPVLTVGKEYSFSAWVISDGAAAVGETVRIAVATDGASPMATSADVVLSQVWQRLGIQGLVPSDATFVRVSLATPSVFDSPSDTFLADGFHASPSFTAREIVSDPTFVGTKWGGVIEYDDTYRKSGGVLLRRLAASVGGHLYESVDGSFVFEDYSTRDPAVVSIPRLRLSAAHDQGGIPFLVDRYEQPTTSQAGTVRVGSFGDLVSIPSDVEDAFAKMTFSLEANFPIAIASNEVRTFFGRHNSSSGETGQLIGRRPFPLVLNFSGWATHDTIPTPYIIGYGRGSDLIVKAGGSGNNVYQAFIGAASIQVRSNDRSYVDRGSNDPLMELEMPSQGYKTTAMKDLAKWAHDKYSNGPAKLAVTVSGLSVEHQLEIFGRDVGTPVQVVHPASEQGGFGLDHLFYVEGTEFSYKKGEKPVLKLQLEEA